MKVLVLGASGMAGHVVTLFLKENGYEVDSLAARNKVDEKTTLLDVTDLSVLKSFLTKNSYDAVVNCIGILVKESEERKALAVLINSYLPHFLEELYLHSKTKLIHLSTDYVFASENAPYKENSKYDGESFYGRSKALGEVINNKDLTFRLSIIGPDMRKDGVGLFNWFASQKGTIFGYKGVLWSGVTTIELAKGIKKAIEENLNGIYHLVPKKNISKYDLLVLLKKEFPNKDLKIELDNTKKINTTLINTRKDFSFKVSDYKTMIKEMKAWIDSHEYIYPHYQQEK